MEKISNTVFKITKIETWWQIRLFCCSFVCSQNSSQNADHPSSLLLRGFAGRLTHDFVCVLADSARRAQCSCFWILLSLAYLNAFLTPNPWIGATRETNNKGAESALLVNGKSFDFYAIAEICISCAITILFVSVRDDSQSNFLTKLKAFGVYAAAFWFHCEFHS